MVQKKKKRITSRQAKNRRIFATIIAAILAIIFLTSFSLRPKTEIIWTEYTVSTGDTLWEICHEKCQDGDIRHCIDLICAKNGITGGNIYPGDTILILENCE